MNFFGLLVGSIVSILGIGLTVLLLWKVFDVVRTSNNKKSGNYDEELFEQLAQAFITHKKETERRLENIEAIITEEDELPKKKKSDESFDRVEIEQKRILNDDAEKEPKNKQRIKE